MSSDNDLITVANRYQLLKRIGQGGMGDVYLAHDHSLGRQIAIKTINQELKDNVEVRKRIDRECKLHAALPVHSSIIALHDKIEEDGKVYLILEYFEGETLSSFLKRLKDSEEELSPAAALDIIYQVLEALAHIHEHGILHRDIKPANIMVAPRPSGGYVAKLMDFGIAAQESIDNALTQITSLAAGGPGTPAYMAPERIDPDTYGQPCPATDLYAAGVILYEILGGQPPFQGTLTEVFIAHLTKPIDTNSLPDTVIPGIKKVVAKALSKHPQDRYAQARDFLIDLHTAAIGKETTATHSPLADQTRVDPERTLLASHYGQQTAVNEAVQAAIEQAHAQKKKKRLLLAAGILAATMAGSFAAWHWYKAEPVTSVPKTNLTQSDSILEKTQEKDEGGMADRGSVPSIPAAINQSVDKGLPEKTEQGIGEAARPQAVSEQTSATSTPQTNKAGFPSGSSASLGSSTAQQDTRRSETKAVDAYNARRQQVSPTTQPEEEKRTQTADTKRQSKVQKTPHKRKQNIKNDVASSPPVRPNAPTIPKEDWMIEKEPPRRVY